MRSLLVVVAILVGAIAAGCDHHHDKGPPPPAGTNPVQHEMRLLHEAMRDAVTAIANGDVKKIPESLHKVHAAKEHTGAALGSGAYKPPKNGDKLARFALSERHTRG